MRGISSFAIRCGQPPHPCHPNIAEGFQRGGDKEFRQFLPQAKGSAGEVKSQLYTALDAGFITQSTFDELNAVASLAENLIGGFMRYLKTSNMGGPKFK